MNGTISCGCINSKGEREIADYLRENNIRYEVQYSFSDLVGIGNAALHFDFAIFNEKGMLVALVEFQGEQHFEPVKFFGGEDKFNKQVENDNRKRDYCASHGIELIEISYWENIDYVLGKFKKK